MADDHTGRVIDQLLLEADKLYQMGRVQQAVNLLQQTIEQFPAEIRALHTLARILVDGNQFEDGLDLLRKMPASNRCRRNLELTACCLMGLNRLAEARQLIQKILADDSDSALGLSLLGQLAYVDGDQIAAERYFNEAIKRGADSGLALVYLGIIHWDRGQAPHALDLIQSGFSRNPTDITAATTYHTAVTELGAFERSEAVFGAAAKDNPYNERLQHLLIDVLIRQQKFAAALKEIKRALAVFGAGNGMMAAAEKIKSLAGLSSVDRDPRAECNLSVCLIVKNEEAHLAKCLLSIEPVADEIIVADTGSTDHSKAIAGLFGAHVFDFKWVDDFAKAKNYATSKACGDWILSLDADEVISPLDHVALRKLVDQSAPKDVAYSIVTRNYMNRVNAVGWSPNDGKYRTEEAGYGWFPSEKVRLFPNDDRIRFEYPVHEMVEPALERLGIDIRPCQIPVHHYGKLDERNSAAKGKRYYRIGVKKLAEMANSVDAMRELAIQAANLEEYEDAVSLWQQVIALQPEMADAYVNMGTANFNLGQYHEAVAAAEKALRLAPHLKEAHFNYSLTLMHLGRVQIAVPVLESLVADFPEYRSARFLLAAALCCNGQAVQGAGKFQELMQTPLGPGLATSCHTLAEGLRSAGQSEYSQAILDAAHKFAGANEDLHGLTGSDLPKTAKIDPHTPASTSNTVRLL